MAERWYVIRTDPKAEYMAASELDRAGFEVLLPCVNTPNPRTGHDDEPLFPGYLFLKCDFEKGAPSLYQVAPHASSWVTFGDTIPALPDEIVRLLTQRLVTTNQEGGLWRRYPVGEKVYVTAGNLQGLAEVVQEPRSPQDRARVLLEFMGRLVVAQVPWQDLRPAENDSKPHHRNTRRTRGRGRRVQGLGLRAMAAT